MFFFSKFIDIFEDSYSFSYDNYLDFLNIRQNKQMYQNLVLFPGYVVLKD